MACFCLRQQNVVKITHMKFHQNPWAKSRTVPYGQTDSHDVNSPFCQRFANGPTNSVSISLRTDSVSILNTKQLKMFMEIYDIYCEHYTRHRNRMHSEDKMHTFQMFQRLALAFRALGWFSVWLMLRGLDRDVPPHKLNNDLYSAIRRNNKNNA